MNIGLRNRNGDVVVPFPKAERSPNVLKCEGPADMREQMDSVGRKHCAVV